MGNAPNLEGKLNIRIAECAKSSKVQQFCWLARGEGKCAYLGAEAQVPIYKQGYQGYRPTYFCNKSQNQILK